MAYPSHLGPAPELGDKEFHRISQFMYQECGIKLPIEKRIMMTSRLQNRLKKLNLSSFREYTDLVFDGNNPNEVLMMIDALTTNKTDFFREPAHFDFFSSIALPEYSRQQQSQVYKAWSAGCSSGEEPYSMGMALSEHAFHVPGFSFHILATDISTRMLDHAVTAIYPESKVEDLLFTLKKKYLLRSIDRNEKKVRIIPELRQRILFQRHNLIHDQLPQTELYHAIFCRNVLIYFDQKTQSQVLEKLCKQLHTGGYLFIGHSETLTNPDLPLRQIQPSLYIKI